VAGDLQKSLTVLTELSTRSMERRRILQASSSCTNSSKRKPFAWRIGGSLPMTSTIGGFSIPMTSRRFAWKTRPFSGHSPLNPGLCGTRKSGCLRVDHPDGLYDPAQYFERLKRSIAEATRNSEKAGSGSRYVVIEKILTGSERLPAQWPVCGTTGYDFSNLVNGCMLIPAPPRA